MEGETRSSTQYDKQEQKRGQEKRQLHQHGKQEQKRGQEKRQWHDLQPEAHSMLK